MGDDTIINGTKEVPVRKVEVYQADDGRRIECFEKNFSVPFQLPPNKNNDDIPVFSDEERLFIGVAYILTNMGQKDLKFEIPDVKTIEEAFSKYYFYSERAYKELETKIQEAQQNSKNTIIKAPASMLNDIENIDGKDTGIFKL